MTTWKEIIIHIKTCDLEAASAIAQMIASRGIYIEDYSDFDSQIQQFGPVEIIDEQLLSRDRTTAKLHIYFSPDENPAESISYMTARLDTLQITYTMETASVQEEDWVNNWKKHFKPTPVGSKLLLVPTWEQERVEPSLSLGRTTLLIDPCMAFGSGQHETTRLCMELIEKFVTPEAQVLDVGTGSGILAISALLLGARQAAGIDIDRLSVKVAAENAQLNGVGSRFTAKHGDLVKDIQGTFQLITANIVADIILELSPDAVKLLSFDGTYIVSGIIEERKQEVLDMLYCLGFYAAEEKNYRGWCAIAARRKCQ